MSAYYDGGSEKFYAYEAARVSSEDCDQLDWRYDVQGHISFVSHNDAGDELYLCLTDAATSDITKYYYAQLHPCATNNQRQIWKYNPQTKQMSNQYTGNNLQEIGWHLATSGDSNLLNKIQVTGAHNFLNTIAPPYTLAYEFAFHYSDGTKSYTDILGSDGNIAPTPLRYDPTNKQISFLKGGKLRCMKSGHEGLTVDSAFVTFPPCMDRYADGIVPLNQRWNITSSFKDGDDNKQFLVNIRDISGNIFGVETAFRQIGTGFTVKLSVLPTLPKENRQAYIFNYGGETFGRQGYMGSNYVGSLAAEYCPAPGVFERFEEGYRANHGTCAVQCANRQSTSRSEHADLGGSVIPHIKPRL